jgi:3-phenylpropionate/trans-cinnamate dioxygenase ferredoxin subunit
MMPIMELKEVRRMSFVDVAKTTEISTGQMKSFNVSDKEILVVNLEGKFFAIGGKCTHAGGELAKGKLEGKAVICPKHGSKFDVSSGKCIAGPKIGFLKLKGRDEPTYEVKVDNDTIKINL